MHALTTLCTCQTTLIQPSSAAAERVFSLLANSFNSNQESALEYYTFKPRSILVMPVMIGIMGCVWEHYGALWVVCGSIMGGVWEHYG